MTRIAPQLSALAVPIDAVTPHPRNARQGDVGAISASLERFGQQKPIVVQASTMRIVAGNHLWRAAAALGWEAVAANVVDLDDATALAFLIADNRTQELGSTDQDALAAILTELAQTDNLAATGYDGDDVDALLAQLNAAPFDPAAEWGGMPEFAHDDLRPVKQITVSFAHADDVERFARLIEQNVLMTTKSIWYPPAAIGRYADKAFVVGDEAAE